MTNVSLLIIEAIICFIVMIISYKKYKIDGLYSYIIITFILSNIMTLKIIPIYSFDINLGIVPLSTIFIASNIIVQKQSPEEIKKLTLTLVIAAIVSFGILYITSLLNSSNINLFTSKSYDNIFYGSERLYFANIVTILYSLLLNSKLYHYLKAVKNKIWISNLLSAIIIQFIVSVLFNVLAYALIKEWVNIIQFIIIRYFISLLVLIFGTITLYIAKIIKEK